MLLTVTRLLAAQTLFKNWNEEWKNQPRFMQAIDKFVDSWLRRATYRFAATANLSMSSFSTNNGLEGTNNMIKKEYTAGELLGIARFLLLIEQYVQRSIDPERKIFFALRVL